MKQHGYIYAHFFPNDKIYIGQTIVPPPQRWGKGGIGYISHFKIKNGLLLKKHSAKKERRNNNEIC